MLYRLTNKGCGVVSPEVWWIWLTTRTVQRSVNQGVIHHTVIKELGLVGDSSTLHVQLYACCMLAAIRHFRILQAKRKIIRNEKCCRDGMPKSNTNKDLKVKVIYKASFIHHLFTMQWRCRDDLDLACLCYFLTCHHTMLTIIKMSHREHFLGVSFLLIGYISVSTATFWLLLRCSFLDVSLLLWYSVYSMTM